jgi:hypothetical protein
MRILLHSIGKMKFVKLSTLRTQGNKRKIEQASKKEADNKPDTQDTRVAFDSWKAKIKAIKESLVKGDTAKAQTLIKEWLEGKADIKLEEMKNQVAEEMLPEANRFKIVKVRVRYGKIQRRRRVSQIKGWRVQGRTKNGTDTRRLVRMTSREKIRRKIGARRAKYKRRAKLSRIRVKYQRALRRRRGLGV